MTTDRQRSANRRNAQKSTGPRTEHGRATSALNSITNGFFSQEVLLLPGEDPVEHERFRREIRADLAPVGVLEGLLVDKIVAEAWCIKRAYRLEAGLFSRGLPRLVEQHSLSAIKAAFAQLTSMSDAELADVEDDEPDEGENLADGAHLALSFVENARRDDVMSKYLRYRTAFMRAFFQALHELQRLQASRAGLPVSPPAAIDVTITGGGSSEAG